MSRDEEPPARFGLALAVAVVGGSRSRQGHRGHNLTRVKQARRLSEMSVRLHRPSRLNQASSDNSRPLKKGLGCASESSPKRQLQKKIEARAELHRDNPGDVDHYTYVLAGDDDWWNLALLFLLLIVFLVFRSRSFWLSARELLFLLYRLVGLVFRFLTRTGLLRIAVLRVVTVLI